MNGKSPRASKSGVSPEERSLLLWYRPLIECKALLIHVGSCPCPCSSQCEMGCLPPPPPSKCLPYNSEHWTGRTCRGSDENGPKIPIEGSSVSYCACTPCVPSLCTLLKKGVETEGLLDYQGMAGIISIVRRNLRPVIFRVEKSLSCAGVSKKSHTKLM